eukprot:230508-Prorocentrum_minimum.AAC.1
MTPMMWRTRSLEVTPSASLPLQQGLRGEHVLHLAGADAEGERAESAVRGGVGVAAHDGHAGEGEALLGADDVHDALALVRQAKVLHAELRHVLLQRQHLPRRGRDGDKSFFVWLKMTRGSTHMVTGLGYGPNS